MPYKNSKRRRAISLVEVIFSMGVILVGLVGVMSILPLAGKRAQDSVSLSVGAAMGDSIVKDVSSRGWLGSNRMVFVNDAGYLRVVSTPTDSTTVLEPFCIDPLFVSGSGVFTSPDPINTPAMGASPNAYNVRYFPFYNLNHDPTVDPSAPTATATPRPAMRRVGLNRVSGSGIVMTASEAFHRGDSFDDLLVQRPKDRTADVFRTGYGATAVPGGLSYASRFATGEFSWIATVTPMPGNVYATLSVVVIRNRQRGFSVPTTAASTPEQNATDERLAHVSFASGFNGGAGGVVNLVSSSSTVTRLRSGDWIMLSNTVGGVPMHRWYRVSAVDGDPEVGTPTPNEIVGLSSSNNDPREVWQRRVYLDGPDWVMAPNTFATLIEGAVSVTNHTIKLNSL